jgi:hypothetical protein
METLLNNERRIQQGENFNLDLLISASQVEYIPFLVSSEIPNPHFVITIASTKFEKNARYAATWWSQLPADHPRFMQTIPQSLRGTDIDPQAEPYVNDDLTPGVPPFDDPPMAALYQYTVISDPINPDTGLRPYRYVYYPAIGARSFTGYDLWLRFNIGDDVTGNWGSQNYMYQISLIGGEWAPYVYESIAEAHGMPEQWPRDPEAVDDVINTDPEIIRKQYAFIKLHWPNDLQPDIDPDSPLGFIEKPQVIMPPTKLIVDNNLRRLI